MRTLRIGSCLAVLAGCTAEQSSSLVIKAASPAAVEARYSEGTHAVHFRSDLRGGRAVGEVFDEHGRSLTGLATEVIQREKPLRGLQVSAQDVAARPAPAQLFEEQARLGTALRLYKHALRQVQDVTPASDGHAPVVSELRRQLTVLRDAHASTHRALVQQWSAEVARDLSLTGGERERLAAIYAQSGKPGGDGLLQAAEIRDQVVALLGPERSARFEAHRRNWFALQGEGGVAP